MELYINLKVNFRGNSKSFLLSGSETKSWESLEAMMKRSFGLCGLQLTYYDEENEEVMINNQVDYEEALKSAAKQGNRLTVNVYEMRGQTTRVNSTKPNSTGTEAKRGFRPPHPNTAPCPAPSSQPCSALAQVVSRKVQAVVPDQSMMILKEMKGTKEEDKTPPAWFTSYMEKFKDQVVREAVEKICREFSGQCCIHKPVGGASVSVSTSGVERGEAVGAADAPLVPEVSSALPGAPSSSTPACSACRGQTTGGGFQCRERSTSGPLLSLNGLRERSTVGPLLRQNLLRERSTAGPLLRQNLLRERSTAGPLLHLKLLRDRSAAGPLLRLNLLRERSTAGPLLRLHLLTERSTAGPLLHLTLLRERSLRGELLLTQGIKFTPCVV